MDVRRICIESETLSCIYYNETDAIGRLACGFRVFGRFAQERRAIGPHVDAAFRREAAQVTCVPAPARL